MAEEQTNEQQTTETETKTYSEEQYNSLKGNLVGQIGELKNELGTFKSQAEERAKQDAELENQRLAENNQHKELLEKSQSDWNNERDELTKQIESFKVKETNMIQDNVLLTNGITDEIQILGLKAKYRGTEDAPDFGEWLTTQNLVPENKGKPSGNTGHVKQSSVNQVNIPTTHAEAQGMTREQKAKAREAIRANARSGLIG